MTKEEYILGTLNAITPEDLKDCWSGGMEEYNAIQEFIKMYKELKQKHQKVEDEYMIQKHLINAEFLTNYVYKDKIREEIGNLEIKYEEAGEDSANRQVYLYMKYALEKLLEKY